MLPFHSIQHYFCVLYCTVSEQLLHGWLGYFLLTSSALWCVTFLGVVSLLATCLSHMCLSRAGKYLGLCLLPDQFLFFMIFALGSAPLRFHLSLSSPSVKVVFPCQTCPGYSPIHCRRESLFSFLDFFFFPWRYFTLGSSRFPPALHLSAFFTQCWKISICLAAASSPGSALPVTEFLISN